MGGYATLPILAVAIAAPTVLAQAPGRNVLTEARWLSPGAGAEALASQPREFLAPVPAGDRAAFLFSLGRLAFRSPSVFGGWIGREGLSCRTCHSGGATNVHFFVRQASDRPGNVDVSHVYWHPAGEDGRANFINIPSLRGIAATAPYGRDGRLATIAEFTRGVIVKEFAGPEPSPLLLDALVAYQAALAYPPNRRLAADGGLSAEASEAARRGEARFRRDCASCHQPEAGFVDRRSHDVGTGGSFDTPTLLGLAESAPYFHDGRAADLGSVVDHFNETLRLSYDARGRAEMIAYLEAVGAVDDGLEPASLAGDVADVRAFASLLRTPLAAKDAELVDWISRLVRRQLRLIDERFHRPEHGPAHDTLVGWSRRLGEVAAQANQGRFAEAEPTLAEWDEAVGRELPGLARHEPTSLYRREEIAKLR